MSMFAAIGRKTLPYYVSDCFVHTRRSECARRKLGVLLLGTRGGVVGIAVFVVG
jgi:hypothetical protein